MVRIIERLIEGNAKCRHLRRIYLERDFAAGVYLSEAHNPIPPLTHCIRVYSILIHTGKGERESRTREMGKGASLLKDGTKIATC
jgi:hypothetical protein